MTQKSSESHESQLHATWHAIGRISKDLATAADDFVAWLSEDELQAAESGRIDLFQLFCEQTPEWDSPAGSEASDARDAICFSVENGVA